MKEKLIAGVMHVYIACEICGELIWVNKTHHRAICYECVPPLTGSIHIVGNHREETPRSQTRYDGALS